MTHNNKDGYFHLLNSAWLLFCPSIFVALIFPFYLYFQAHQMSSSICTILGKHFSKAASSGQKKKRLVNCMFVPTQEKCTPLCLRPDLIYLSLNFKTTDVTGSHRQFLLPSLLCSICIFSKHNKLTSKKVICASFLCKLERIAVALTKSRECTKTQACIQ